MTPLHINILVMIAIFITTVATIVQVIHIDLRYGRRPKAKRANLIVWMVFSGALFNAPFIWQVVSGLN